MDGFDHQTFLIFGMKKQLGKAINFLIEPLGLRLVGSNKAREGSHEEVLTEECQVRVGKFVITIPSANPLSTVYACIPTFGSFLTRVCAEIGAHEPRFHAVDIGANVGDTLALIRSGWSCPCICIEGDPRCFALLQRNLQLFNATSAHNIWLGEATASASVVMAKAGWNTTFELPAAGSEGTTVRLMAFDEFIQAHPARSLIRMFKCDAEGYDLRILRGARAFLRDVKPVLLFEYNRENLDPLGEDGISTLELLRQIGYDSALVYDNKGRLLLKCSFRDKSLLLDLHEYSDGKTGMINYYDIITWHQDDNPWMSKFATNETTLRRGHQLNDLQRPALAHR